MAEPQLHKSLTWTHGTGMAIGAVLGSGILILPAITAEQAGPASVLAWLLMSVLAFPLAATLGRLGARYPHAGGMVEYARLAFGATAARMTAWLFLGTIPVGVPIIALVGADYVVGAFGMQHWMAPIIAAVLLTTSLTLHRFGVELASWVQNLVLLLITVLMVIAIAAAGSHVMLHNFHPLTPHGWLPVGTSAVEIFWCFVGWEMVGHLAEEFRDPVRDLRRTFVLAPMLVAVLYLALSVVTVGTHAYGPGSGVAPLSQLVGIGFGHAASMATGTVALLVTLVAIHGNVAGFSRMVYSQARAGVFPGLLGRLHEKHRTPVGALYALGLDFALVLSAYTWLHVNLAALVKWPSTVFLVLYGVAMMAAVKLMVEESWSMKLTAIIPVVVCAILYPFSGWAMVYPIGLAITGFALKVNHRNVRMSKTEFKISR